MATAMRVQERTTIEQERIGATTTLSGDRSVAEAVVANVADFLLSHSTSGEHTAILRNLRIKPLSNSELLAGYKLIQEIDIIVVVSNDTNRDPSDGGVMCTRGLKVHLDRNVTFLSASDKHQLMAKHGSRRSLDLLGISRNAYEALGREVARVIQGSRAQRVQVQTVTVYRQAPAPAPAPAPVVSIGQDIVGTMAGCFALAVMCTLFIMLIVGIAQLSSCDRGESEECDSRRRTGTWLVVIPCVLVVCACLGEGNRRNS